MWGVHESARHLERANFAHKVYESYLTLSNHTYQLFKQFGDVMLIGDRDRGIAASELMGKIRADIARIRNLIGYEIELVGEEEISELAELALIESQLAILLAEYQEILQQKEGIVFTETWGRLSRMLDHAIDQDFQALITAAIDHELEEVQETRAEASRTAGFFKALAGVFALLAIAAATLGLRRLLRDVQAPIKRLLAGTAALERGELEYRGEMSGPVELAEVARAFNAMAAKIATREKALAESNLNLEKTVASRTIELRRLLDTLRVGEENRKRLLADVSHELRTPLTVIRGEADIALRGKPKTPEVYREALARCREAANHTARLVDDLLFVSRSEGGEVRLKLSEIDLVPLLPGAIDEGRGLVAGQSSVVMFATDLSRAVIRADEGRIRQVTLILLENALRYGATGIQVRLDQTPTGYRISVSDNGPGLTEEEQACAFDRFFRGSNAARRYEQGAGLGLPVAKAIVEAHGGTIVLDSEVGQGLTASFTLPNKPQLKAVS